MQEKGKYLFVDIEQTSIIQFTSLEKSRYCLPSWTISGFWENIRNPKFREIYLEKLINFIVNEVSTSNEKINNVPPKVFNALLSILLIIVSFNFDSEKRMTIQEDSQLPTQISKETRTKSLSKIDWFQNTTKLNELGIPIIQKFIILVPGIFGQSVFPYTETLKLIFNLQHIPFFDYSTPFFSLYGLFAHLKRYPQNITTFIDTLKDFLSRPMFIHQTKIFIHIIRLIFIFFPGYFQRDFSDLFYQYLGTPDSVSFLTSELAITMKKEVEFPGSTYFKHLTSISTTNIAFSSNIPTFLSSAVPYLDSLINNNYSENSSISIQSSFVSFARFFINQYFNCQNELTIPQLFELCSEIEFTKSQMNHICQKYTFTPKNPNQQIEIELPKHPFLKLLIQKVSLDTEIKSGGLTVKYGDNEIFQTTASFIFKKQLFTPIKTFLAKQMIQEDDLFEFHVLLLGDDLLIANALLSFVSELQQFNELAHHVTLIYHIVPIDDSKSNQIADFISTFDIIYDEYLRHTYPITTSVLPTINENSEALSFSLLNDKNDHFENTIWFGTPSPTNMFKFSVQHYLQFAHETVDVIVWQCLIEYALTDSQKKIVVVPFVTSVQIGTAFSQTAQMLMPEITQSSSNQSGKPDTDKTTSEIQGILVKEDNESGTVRIQDINEFITKTSKKYEEGEENEDNNDTNNADNDEPKPKHEKKKSKQYRTRTNTTMASFNSDGAFQIEDTILGTSSTDTTEQSEQFVISSTDVSLNETTKTYKASSMAFWNANTDIHVVPTDGWLMMEVTSSKIKFNNEKTRIENVSKLQQEIVVKASVEKVNHSPFNATIDHNTYGPLSKITISPLICGSDVMRMRFASFLPMA